MVMQADSTDHALHLVALGIIAFVISDVTHEMPGHGPATLSDLAKHAFITLLRTDCL